MTRNVSPWYAGLLWNVSIIIFGGIAAFVVVFIPFMLWWHHAYGLDTRPSEFTLRSVQIIEAIVLYPSGGWLASHFLRNRFPMESQLALKWAWRCGLTWCMGLTIMAICIGSWHYGSASTWSAGMWLNFFGLFSLNGGGLLLATRYFYPRTGLQVTRSC